MAYPPRYQQISGGSGTLTAAPVAGTTTGGTAIATSGMDRETVSCLFNVLAETSTLTLTTKFQISHDQATWYDLADNAQNPANVVLTTGTDDTDTTTTRVLPLPPTALGWEYVRAAMV